MHLFTSIRSCGRAHTISSRKSINTTSAPSLHILCSAHPQEAQASLATPTQTMASSEPIPLLQPPQVPLLLHSQLVLGRLELLALETRTLNKGAFSATTTTHLQTQTRLEEQTQARVASLARLQRPLPPLEVSLELQTTLRLIWVGFSALATLQTLHPLKRGDYSENLPLLPLQVAFLAQITTLPPQHN